MNIVLRLLSFSLCWLLTAPHWLALWAYFLLGEWVWDGKRQGGAEQGGRAEARL